MHETSKFPFIASIKSNVSDTVVCTSKKNRKRGTHQELLRLLVGDVVEAGVHDHSLDVSGALLLIGQLLLLI
jgi:hypothetical protein